MLFLICSYYILPAQNYQKNNFEKAEKGTKEDTVEVSRLNKLAYDLRFSDFRQMTVYGTKALQMAQRLNFKKGKAVALRLLGISQGQQSNHIQSRKYYKQSLKLFWELKDTVTIAQITNDTGIGYQTQSNNLMALKYYQKALELLENFPKEFNTKASMLSNIGIIYYSQKKLTKALEYYQKAYQVAKQTKNEANLTDIKNNIATTYFYKGEYSQAQKIYQQNMPGYQKANDQIGVLLSQGNIGICQCKQQQTTQGIKNLQLALSGFKQGNQKFFRVAFLNFLGECYLIQKQQEKSQQAFLAALVLAKEIKLSEEAIKSLKHLSRLYKHQGNFEKSLSYQEQYQELNDSIFNQENSLQLLGLQMHYETEQKEKALELKNQQIALLKKNEAHERLQNRALLGLLITVSIISGLVILLLRLMVRKKRIVITKNKELHQAEQYLHEARLTEEKLVAESLQRSLDLKNQQLSSKALHIIQKNEMLQKVRGDLKDVNNKGKHNKELYQIMQTIDYSFSLDKDWLNFFNFFEEVHPHFFDKIRAKSTNLSPQDLRLCALIKLRFNSKEISSILGIALNSVSAARHRVRKKLEIPKEQRLSDFIAEV